MGGGLSDRGPSCACHPHWPAPEGANKGQQIQPLGRSRSNRIAEIYEKEWIFLLRSVFNFLCLPPKGFFIDKALCSVGREAEEKLLMERLAIGDTRGLVAGLTAQRKCGRAQPAWPGHGRRAQPPGGQAENQSQVCCGQGPGVSEHVARPETSVLENRFLETGPSFS